MSVREPSPELRGAPPEGLTVWEVTYADGEVTKVAATGDNLPGIPIRLGEGGEPISFSARKGHA